MRADLPVASDGCSCGLTPGVKSSSSAKRLSFDLNDLLGRGPATSQPDYCPPDHGTDNATPDHAFGEAIAAVVGHNCADNETRDGEQGDKASVSLLSRLGSALATNLVPSFWVRLKKGLGDRVCLQFIHLR